MPREIVRAYSGKELSSIEQDKRVPLVEGILFESDYVMVAAPPKIGKSIFVQQLTCSLSSGTPFLETFAVPNPVMVWYFATEGKDEDTKDRLIRMSHAIPIDYNNICLFCSAGLRFNTSVGQKLLEDINSTWGLTNPPKVIIIDALYRAIKGSLKDDDVVNEFHQVIGELADRYSAAVIIVHHMKKPVYFESGQKQQSSDDDVFGSTFLKASVDQMYWMEKCTKATKTDKESKDIILKCDTQRSGNAIEELRLSLVEPDPLYYKITSMYIDEVHRILTVLNSHKGGMIIVELMKSTGLNRTTLYLCLKELEELGKIKKTITRPVVYKLY